MKNYRWVVLTTGIGIAAALLLHAAKTDGRTVITGSNPFTNTASISPGLARRITVRDLPQPQPPGVGKSIMMMAAAGFGGPAKRPDNAIPKAPAGFKVNLYVSSGLPIIPGKSAALRTVIFSSRTPAAARFESFAASQARESRASLPYTPVSTGHSASTSIRRDRTHDGSTYPTPPHWCATPTRTAISKSPASLRS